MAEVIFRFLARTHLAIRQMHAIFIKQSRIKFEKQTPIKKLQWRKEENY